MNVKLNLLNKGQPAQQFALDELPAYVGRGDEATVTLPDRWVSRLHCCIDEADGMLFVRDLGSKHGTFVNDCRISESPLQPGDTLSIGMSTLQVIYDLQREWRVLSPIDSLIRG